MTIQSLLTEALNDLFEKQGYQCIAESPQIGGTMKTLKFLAFTFLLTFLVGLPPLFAQEENLVGQIDPEEEEILDPEPTFVQATDAVYRMVRLVYLLPNDREPQPDIDVKIDALIKETQQFFADEMERHGYGRKTFRFESDENGDAIVHHIISYYDDEYFRKWDHEAKSIRDYFGEDYGYNKYIYLIAIDVSTEQLGGRYCGLFTSSNNLAIVPASGHCFRRKTVAHELGHGFGLTHNFYDRIYTLSYGGSPNHLLSACATKWLDVSPYFNPDKVIHPNKNTSLQLLSTSYDPTPPYKLRLRFEVNDPDGIHQILLITRGSIAYSEYVDCQSLQSTQDIVDIVTTQPVKIATILVIDKEGNHLRQGFDIENTLMPPDTDVAMIPDVNLAQAIRDTLEFAPEQQITRFDLSRLIDLEASNLRIKDITGLQHAIKLTSLNLQSNQIQDITPLVKLTPLRTLLLSNNQIRDLTPLSDLTNLEELFLDDTGINDLTQLTTFTQLSSLLLRRNGITDLTPLATLTHLERLSIDSNQVVDITPLATLTHLKDLSISDNQIRDIRPLAELTQLEMLYLEGNQIKDITPLAKMTKLHTLYLKDNQIRDFSVLADMEHLAYVVVYGNPIKSMKPLLTLLRKNPDVEIYTKSEGGILPVTLSSFKAIRTTVGAIINWTTESEVDNAGFNILRSRTKTGEFEKINAKLIQGAGTTSERSTYTWTDTTAKPNTVYYYRIEDVSHAGVHQTLTTTRLRGLISAKGKMITQWADFKKGR